MSCQMALRIMKVLSLIKLQAIYGFYLIKIHSFFLGDLQKNLRSDIMVLVSNGSQHDIVIFMGRI